MSEPERPWPLLALGGVALVLASAVALAGYVAFPFSVVAAAFATVFARPPRGGVRRAHYVAFVLLLGVAALTSAWVTRLWTH